MNTTYLLPFELACHRLRPFDDTLDVCSDVEPEAHVDLWHLAAMVLVQPSHRLVTCEQAELVLEFVL